MWPKKQVNKPFLKPAMFGCTLCRGQNLGILPGPLGHCLQMVWRRPTQNCRSKRCQLGASIPIWKWTELSESYGILAVRKSYFCNKMCQFFASLFMQHVIAIWSVRNLDTGSYFCNKMCQCFASLFMQHVIKRWSEVESFTIFENYVYSH
jgi:hypothetical protein